MDKDYKFEKFRGEELGRRASSLFVAQRAALPQLQIRARSHLWLVLGNKSTLFIVRERSCFLLNMIKHAVCVETVTVNFVRNQTMIFP